MLVKFSYFPECCHCDGWTQVKAQGKFLFCKGVSCAGSASWSDFPTPLQKSEPGRHHFEYYISQRKSKRLVGKCVCKGGTVQCLLLGQRLDWFDWNGNVCVMNWWHIKRREGVSFTY